MRMSILRVIRASSVLLLAAAAAGCYHATIETGMKPNGEMINKPWATSFVYGLVPPPVVETASKCANGVARVETQLSFLNQIVNILTLGIFTPMTITVACAGLQGALLERPDRNVGETIHVPAGSSREELQFAFNKAIQYTTETHRAALVTFAEIR